ncbi:MAG: biopolymer transporter ExbD [Gammaproteobacteria bacterium]|nr:MAG: biopolymer transporter ExbD [Gammaproteobacteria bacterium]
MRRRRHLQNTDADSEINLTPMLDIVFIMLIFFIVTTSFIKESGIDINRPSAKTSVTKERTNAIVGIKRNGEIWIDKRQVDIRAVRSHVEQLLTETPNPSVVIAADKDVKAGIMVAVMDQVRMAGVENVSIATQENSQ